MADDLDIDKLRAVTKAVMRKDWSYDDALAFHATFNPTVVLRLLDLAQNWHNAVEKGRGLQEEARQALAQRPPASNAKQRRELAALADKWEKREHMTDAFQRAASELRAALKEKP